MKCPCCQSQIPELWQKTYTHTNAAGKGLEIPVDEIRAPYSANVSNGFLIRRDIRVSLTWMQCPNEACQEILVSAQRVVRERGSNDLQYGKWFAVPRKPSPRPIDPLVKDPFRFDYLEASVILEDSPRTSAMLARRILADLLEEYGHVQRSLKLSKMIDNFVESGQHPSYVTENLHYLREIADFGAHTQKDELGNIVDVEPNEAEWTLNVVDTLFDYFIVGPEKDKMRRGAFDKKVAAAKRKPIGKQSEDKS